MSPLPYQHRRRTVLVNPRLQFGVALVFSAVVLLGGALFAWIVYRGCREALWTASIRGHLPFGTPYQVVGDTVTRQLAVLFATIVTVCTAAFLYLMVRIRDGMTRLVETLRVSGEGDLSTPTDAPGLREIGLFGSQLDAARAETLARIGEIREEVDFLRRGPLPQEEFQDRWDALKERIGRIVP